MSNYLGGPGPEVYYSLPAAITKNTYTTQAVISAVASSSIPRCMIPALYFNAVGKGGHFEANGTIASAAGTATFAFGAGLAAVAVTVGGTGCATLFNSATVTPAITTVFPFTLEFDVTCTAVGNLGTTLQLNGEIDIHGGASNTWSTGRNANMIAATLTGINNEINLWLELFGTWSVSAAGNTTTLQQFKLWLES